LKENVRDLDRTKRDIRRDKKVHRSEEDMFNKEKVKISNCKI
jgi:hypothetical protein